jgi:hypothetical protein
MGASPLLKRAGKYHVYRLMYKGFEMSLYKGELSVALILAEMQAPETALLPFFASEPPPERSKLNVYDWPH